MDRRDGFTLIELLVVIAIISLLVSILLPSLTRAKDLAKTVLCQSNLRGLGTVFYFYSEEYDQWAPPVKRSDHANGQWWVYREPWNYYIGRDYLDLGEPPWPEGGTLLCCPADESPEGFYTDPARREDEKYYSTYAKNYHLGPAYGHDFSPPPYLKKMDQIRCSPSEMMYAVGFTGRTVGAWTPDSPPASWLFVHDDRNTFLWADGSASFPNEYPFDPDNPPLSWPDEALEFWRGGW